MNQKKHAWPNWTPKDVDFKGMLQGKWPGLGHAHSFLFFFFFFFFPRSNPLSSINFPFSFFTFHKYFFGDFFLVIFVIFQDEVLVFVWETKPDSQRSSSKSDSHSPARSYLLLILPHPPPRPPLCLLAGHHRHCT